jgi:hypothetical protein
METVDQPLDDHAGHRLGILGGHRQARQRLLPLALDLRRQEGRATHHVGHDRQPGGVVVLHDDGIDVAEVGTGPGAEDGAEVVDIIGDLLGIPRASTLVEQRRGQHRHSHLGPGIVGRAGTHDHAHADGRLLVLADQHHGEAVGQLLHLEGRERDRARFERPRRKLARPLTAGLGHGQRRQHGKGERGDDERLHGFTPSGVPAPGPFGLM